LTVAVFSCTTATGVILELPRFVRSVVRAKTSEVVRSVSKALKVT